jgi:carbon-monoxide dehydrogenase large subunit
MDYMLPTAAEMPRIRLLHQHSPSPLNPYGVKGVGEGGPIAPPAAIANALAEALRPFTPAFDETPIAPHQVMAALRAAAAS